MTDKETIIIELVDAGGHGDVPLASRLKRALKMMLRSYGLRCRQFHTQYPVIAPQGGWRPDVHPDALSGPSDLAETD